MFGKRSKKLKMAQRGDSFVREWALLKKEQLKDSHDASYPTVFAVMMWFVVMFNNSEHLCESGQSLAKETIATLDSFSSDEAFFEVACYMLFRIDLWLIENYTETSQEILAGFLKELQTLFEQPLNLSNLDVIVDNRLSGYAGIFRQGKDSQYIHSQLSSLISLSRENQPLNCYEFTSKLNSSIDVVEEILLKASLIAWDVFMLPVVLESLKRFCEAAFDRPSQNDAIVRTWAKQQNEDLQYSSDLSPEKVFTVLMSSVVSFCDPEDASNSKEPVAENQQTFLARYGHDGALFEVTCYWMFRVDIWLSTNRPQHREAISKAFFRELVSLFSKPLRSNDLESIVILRIAYYSELAESGMTIRSIHEHLAKFLALSKFNQVLEESVTQSDVEATRGDVDDKAMKANLAVWEAYTLSSTLKALEEYCDTCFD